MKKMIKDVGEERNSGGRVKWGVVSDERKPVGVQAFENKPDKEDKTPGQSITIDKTPGRPAIKVTSEKKKYSEDLNIVGDHLKNTS